MNEIRPVFLPVTNPKGCGANNHCEYVNVCSISKIVPPGADSLNDKYTVFYKTSNEAGAERNCTAKASAEDIKRVLDLLG